MKMSIIKKFSPLTYTLYVSRNVLLEKGNYDYIYMATHPRDPDDISLLIGLKVSIYIKQYAAFVYSKGKAKYCIPKKGVPFEIFRSLGGPFTLTEAKRFCKKNKLSPGVDCYFENVKVFHPEPWPYTNIVVFNTGYTSRIIKMEQKFRKKLKKLEPKYVIENTEDPDIKREYCTDGVETTPLFVNDKLGYHMLLNDEKTWKSEHCEEIMSFLRTKDVSNGIICLAFDKVKNLKKIHQALSDLNYCGSNVWNSYTNKSKKVLKMPNDKKIWYYSFDTESG